MLVTYDARTDDANSNIGTAGDMPYLIGSDETDRKRYVAASKEFGKWFSTISSSFSLSILISLEMWERGRFGF